MKQQINASLTGTDGPVNGNIKKIDLAGIKNAYRFDSIDGTLHLIIALDTEGKWQKIEGTEPYLFGWIDEMAEQISKLQA